MTSGLVSECHILEPTYAPDKIHRVKNIKVIPFAYEHQCLLNWLGACFGKRQLYAQVTTDVALTFTTRKEGAQKNNPGASPKKLGKYAVKVKAQDPSSSSSAPTSTLPNFRWFEDEVPIYDCRDTRLHFNSQDFAGLKKLPSSKEDLPPNSLVCVEYTANSFPYAGIKDAPKTETANHRAPFLITVFSLLVMSDVDMSVNEWQDPTGHYVDPMEEEDELEEMNVDDQPEHNVVGFRRQSAMLPLYPWSNGGIMMLDLSKAFDKEHYAFRFALSLQRFDTRIVTISAANTYVCTAMRDIKCDRFANMSLEQIALAEGKELKSPGHASEVCSALTAYCVFDVIYGLDNSENLPAPEHERLNMDFSKYPVSKQIVDWTTMASKFHKRFESRSANQAPAVTYSMFASQQVQALLQLHSVIKSNKALLNLQLAATHLAFLLDHDSDGKKIPDLPTSLSTLDTSNASTSAESAALNAQFETLLQCIAENQKFDHLRLPLQVAALLSPIFLLQEGAIHKSKYYSQRYKLMMYSKCLGNKRPKSVIELETIIWKALLDIACGQVDVYAAGERISKAIPAILEKLEDGDTSWFFLDNAKNKDAFHLSSFQVVENTVPADWPMASILAPPPLDSDAPHEPDHSSQSPEVQSQAQLQPQLQPQTPEGAADVSRPQTDEGNDQLQSPPNATARADDPEPPHDPEDSMDADNDPPPAVTPAHSTSTRPVRKARQQKRPYEEVGEEDASEGERFTKPPTKAGNAKRPRRQDTARSSSTTGDLRLDVRQRPALPIIFKGKYMQIEVIDLTEIETENLPTFNAKQKPHTHKTDRLVSGTLRQFIENAESRRDKKVLRIIRMPSETSPSATAFGSEFMAWRETKSCVYCKEEDPSLIKHLLWNDITTEHSAQWWRLSPHGFGLYFDVREGSQWILIATPPNRPDQEQEIPRDYFVDPHFFLSSFQPLKVGSDDMPIDVEAIHLTEGMRIIIPPNTPYAAFTTENCIATGGYYLSIPNMSNSFYGLINSFVLGSLVHDSDLLCPALYFRRIIHYLHSTFVINNSATQDNDDYHHLFTFQDLTDDEGLTVKSAIQDVESSLCLFAIAIFMNALDKRTYIPLVQAGTSLSAEDRAEQRKKDLNSIPHIECCHFCYVRGLAFDLIGWFFHHYDLQKDGKEPTQDAYLQHLVPFIALMGRNMVEMALFNFEGFEEEYRKLVAEENDFDEGLPPLTFQFNEYRVMPSAKPTSLYEHSTDYFQAVTASNSEKTQLQELNMLLGSGQHDFEVGTSGEGSRPMDEDSLMERMDDMFRHRSQTFVVHPWRRGAVMLRNLSEVFDQQHYAFAIVLDKFDRTLASTSPTHAYLRTAMRDKACDRLSGKTVEEIVAFETRDQSAGHASAVCSVFTAYRIFDIIYLLEKPNGALQAPVHQRLEVNFNEYLISKQVGDWTSIASKFHDRFVARMRQTKSTATFTTFASRQVHALFHLDSTIKNNKQLFNLQLAATHLAFILDHDSDGKGVPDLPTSLTAFQPFKAMTSIESAALNVQFEALLDSIGEIQKLDHLRLPVQVAALISPIFLLMDTFIHKSKYFCQRYKLMLYSKFLGNQRPKSVIALENVIWKALLDIARGAHDVYAAAKEISDTIPNILDDLEDADDTWFRLANPAHKQMVHLSSFNVVPSSVPAHWPMLSMLQRQAIPPISSIAHSSVVGEQENTKSTVSGDVIDMDIPMSSLADDAMDVDSIPSPKPSSPPSPPPPALQVAAHNTKRKHGGPERETSHGEQALRRSTRSTKAPVGPLVDFSSSDNANANSNASKRRKKGPPKPVLLQKEEDYAPPCVIGSKYVHFSVIDLTQIEREADVKIFINLLSSVTTGFSTGRAKHISHPEQSIFTIIKNAPLHAMTPSDVQIQLRKGVIVVPDATLATYQFCRRAIRAFNSLNIDVKIDGAYNTSHSQALRFLMQPEDQSLSSSNFSNIKTGTLLQFIENAELPRTRKVLRVIRAPSDEVQQLPFATDLLAWRETRSLTYCKEEDNSMFNILRWNEFSNTNAIQGWRLIPHGFGAFFDVRAGAQWIFIAGPACSPFNPDIFADLELFIDGPEGSKIINPKLTQPEAMLLTAGMWIILPPNTLYAMLTVKDCIMTGGYFLSAHSLSSSIYGLIHGFILGTSAADADDILPGLFIRRLLHYLHTSYVVNNLVNTDDDYHHLLTFNDIKDEEGCVVKKGVDDVKALFALFAMAVFANVLDERTYMPFVHTVEGPSAEERQVQKANDINAIPLLERRHYCYARGLAIDLLRWFFNHYSLAKPNQEADDGYRFLLLPITAELGTTMVAYKLEAEGNQHPGLCDGEDFCMQVELAVALEGMKETYEGTEDPPSTLAFNFDDYDVLSLQTPENSYPPIDNFFECGKNLADVLYFSSLQVMRRRQSGS
ncbi:hypothetical protein M413DRAFT_32284 [Hebeloma cylindrosporum]|uniref:JmjC domain-containing protein n=1 Tax=Hebeloma cylindrosporum TaxID=76867 RepID=A0A0C2Y3S7_HEBCY|nr:hypothetical protein M413DRAFT_32284 [Hebeloma cylindrosporum h7]